MAQHIIDLSTLSPTQGVVVRGDGGTGYSVSTAGDVNGDGFDDVILGAPTAHYDPLRGWTGRAYVVFGGPEGAGTPIGDRQVVYAGEMTVETGFALQVPDHGRLGDSVSVAGDVNGDGFADMIVSGSGTYVVFGAAGLIGSPTDYGGWPVVILYRLPATRGFVLEGEGVTSVSAAGDVNGDGFADVIVGAAYSGSSAGRAYVVFGGADGAGTTVGGRQVVELTTLGPAEGFVIEGATDEGVGWRVSAAGDVNGDGFADVIISGNVFGPAAGAAYVVFGGAAGFGRSSGAGRSVDLATLAADEGFVIRGEHAIWSVSAAGDVNGDGFADIVVGATYGAYVIFGGDGGFGTTIGGRQVVDPETLTPAQGFVIEGDFVTSVSAAGDVNGDGFGDVIIGDHLNSEAYVVFGGAGGVGTVIGGRRVVDLKTLDVAHGFVIRGPDGEPVGHSVSAAGDVNGDGFDDVIVGAPISGDQGTGYVVYGGNFTDAAGRLGGEGDDLLRSGPVARIVFGAQGDDTLLGNVGADSLNGGSGEDSLVGDAANDTVAGDSGDDHGVGGRGDDRLLGGDGNDTLRGGDGNDSLFGEANDDRVSGGAGDDSLDGGQNRDSLFGGDGADTLAGGGRGDVLVGGMGADVLTGGQGFDRFVFAAGSSSPAAPDTISDFEAGIDKLVIRSGTDHGTFLGAGAFTGGGGIEVRWDAGAHQIQVDLNGDGTLGAGDLAIDGATLASLTADDLLFV